MKTLKLARSWIWPFLIATLADTVAAGFCKPYAPDMAIKFSAQNAKAPVSWRCPNPNDSKFDQKRYDRAQYNCLILTSNGCWNGKPSVEDYHNCFRQVYEHSVKSFSGIANLAAGCNFNDVHDFDTVSNAVEQKHFCQDKVDINFDRLLLKQSTFIPSGPCPLTYATDEQKSRCMNAANCELKASVKWSEYYNNCARNIAPVCADAISSPTAERVFLVKRAVESGGLPASKKEPENTPASPAPTPSAPPPFSKPPADPVSKAPADPSPSALIPSFRAPIPSPDPPKTPAASKQPPEASSEPFKPSSKAPEPSSEDFKPSPTPAPSSEVPQKSQDAPTPSSDAAQEPSPDPKKSADPPEPSSVAPETTPETSPEDPPPKGEPSATPAPASENPAPAPEPSTQAPAPPPQPTESENPPPPPKESENPPPPKESENPPPPPKESENPPPPKESENPPPPKEPENPPPPKESENPPPPKEPENPPPPKESENPPPPPKESENPPPPPKVSDTPKTEPSPTPKGDNGGGLGDITSILLGPPPVASPSPVDKEPPGGNGDGNPDQLPSPVEPLETPNGPGSQPKETNPPDDPNNDPPPGGEDTSPPPGVGPNPPSSTPLSPPPGNGGNGPFEPFESFLPTPVLSIFDTEPSPTPKGSLPVGGGTGDDGNGGIGGGIDLPIGGGGTPTTSPLPDNTDGKDPKTSDIVGGIIGAINGGIAGAVESPVAGETKEGGGIDLPLGDAGATVADALGAKAEDDAIPLATPKNPDDPATGLNNLDNGLGKDSADSQEQTNSQPSGFINTGATVGGTGSGSLAQSQMDAKPEMLPDSAKWVNLLYSNRLYDRDILQTLPQGTPVLVFRLVLECGGACLSKKNPLRTQFEQVFTTDIITALAAKGYKATTDKIVHLNMVGVEGSTIVQFAILPLSDGTTPGMCVDELRAQFKNGDSVLRKGVVTKSVDPHVWAVDIIAPVKNDALAAGENGMGTTLIVFISIGAYILLMILFVIGYRMYVNRVRQDEIDLKMDNANLKSWYYDSLPSATATDYDRSMMSELDAANRAASNGQDVNAMYRTSSESYEDYSWRQSAMTGETDPSATINDRGLSTNTQGQFSIESTPKASRMLSSLAPSHLSKAVWSFFDRRNTAIDSAFDPTEERFSPMQYDEAEWDPVLQDELRNTHGYSEGYSDISEYRDSYQESSEWI